MFSEVGFVFENSVCSREAAFKNPLPKQTPFLNSTEAVLSPAVI